MNAGPWVQALGWFGSALLVFSLLQARMLRLRLLNTVACAILVVFNAILGVWPMVAMNLVLAAINLFFIARMIREKDDDAAYTVLEVDADDRYLGHFLDVSGEDIRRFFPRFDRAALPGGHAYLVQHGNETAGVVVVHDAGEGVAQVDLDYVTPKYRDFSPGEFVYRRSGLFTGRGYRSVLTPPGMVAPYYDRLGFRRVGDHYELGLTADDPASTQ